MVLMQILQVSNKQKQKKVKYTRTTYLSRESAEVIQVQYTSQQINNRGKLRTVEYTSQQRIFRGLPMKVHASAKNQ